MDLSEIVLVGGDEAWIPWKGEIEILMRYVSTALDRSIRAKVTKHQYRGHQKMEAEVDEIALREYYCTQIVKDIRGITKDGQPFGHCPEDFRELWERNLEFSPFVVDASRKIENFLQEKKA